MIGKLAYACSDKGISHSQIHKLLQQLVNMVSLTSNFETCNKMNWYDFSLEQQVLMQEGHPENVSQALQDFLLE